MINLDKIHYYQYLGDSALGETTIYVQFYGESAIRQVTQVNHAIEKSYYSTSSAVKAFSQTLDRPLLEERSLSALNADESLTISAINAATFEAKWEKSISSANRDHYLHYGIGDAVDAPKERSAIAHIVNHQGVWNRGFGRALSNRYPSVKEAYLRWHEKGDRFDLGEVQYVPIEGKELYIVNMLAQDGVRESAADNHCYLKYEALKKALNHLALFALIQQLELIQMPYIGRGSGNGDWFTTESIINDTLCYHKIPTYILKQRGGPM